MSLLLYEQREDCVEILTDTLVRTADGITPSAYHRKAWEYPHLNLVMAVTGTVPPTSLVAEPKCPSAPKR